jgi:hypothetical protein
LASCSLLLCLLLGSDDAGAHLCWICRSDEKSSTQREILGLAAALANTLLRLGACLE